ncbi:ABC-2 type transport system ATP-binding protein/lipopolysaccharide transport system ATP-binding protein [Pectinatus cerevisiiphilus]|uniref:ABC-2 type transport system ATP-binding protein/lipopolysaccharide transport system ATP-binding protein n=2 Tax=Pectinatus cerevisiiphilus TaxID=86956 RepID=A0A4R3K229_9FIRM|nr:ABC-2 type transport system ATP-binding protein/lipopolysaccharide transport system ATP-binding protein [Pectinatus cerevisiiphilus]
MIGELYMTGNIIEIENLTMRFNLAQEQFSGLKDLIIMASKGKLKFNEFYALKNVMLKIKKGEAWGIIGRNGSGKSTLLKLISGIYTPTSGAIKVKGTIAPLIELGAGFDPELTARENIFLNGAVLGYSHRFMQDHFDKIVNFSELEQFIDVPIKNFSSGMVARLGFSIATMVKADILIIDEILAVGDANFQEKCYKRMCNMMENGTTVLFVSHNVKDVEKICKKVLWLEHGQIKMVGNSNEVCQSYQNEMKE